MWTFPTGPTQHPRQTSPISSKPSETGNECLTRCIDVTIMKGGRESRWSARPFRPEDWVNDASRYDHSLGGTTMFGLTLACVISLVSQTLDKPEVKYDKFDDVTVISTVLGKIPGCDAKKSDITLIISHEGKNPQKFDNGWLIVSFSRSDESFEWKDDTLHEVKMMCGDDYIPMFMKATYWSQSYPAINTCTEQFTVEINLKKAKEFLKTNKDWDVRIDFDDPFVLDAKYRAKVLAFIRFLEEGGG